jgi:hypothetical protein
MVAVLDNLTNTLPQGVRSEIELAAARTGWTPDLNKAVDRLRVVFSMMPEAFEQYSATVYKSII